MLHWGMRDIVVKYLKEYGAGTTSLMLEPGTYTMEWCDSI